LEPPRGLAGNESIRFGSVLNNNNNNDTDNNHNNNDTDNNNNECKISKRSK